jgi:Ca2+-binding RTX toxin-like protein
VLCHGTRSTPYRSGATITVRKYGTTWEFYGGKEYREASLYVSDSASDRFGGSGAGTAFKGNGGNDVIYGRGGDDVIAGGTGNDTLVGGSESDSFVFNTTLGSRNIDRITDFSRYQDDKIVLDNNVFVGLRLAPVDSSEVNNDLRYFTSLVGSMESKHFRSGKAALDADDRVLYDKVTGALYFDQDGSGAAAAVKFAQLNAGTSLGYSDFLVC